MSGASFFVAGVPVPQGSTRAFVVNGRAAVTSVSGRDLQAWRTAIQFVAQEKFEALIEGPVGLELEFLLPRPQSTPKREFRPWRTTRQIEKEASRAERQPTEYLRMFVEKAFSKKGREPQ